MTETAAAAPAKAAKAKVPRAKPSHPSTNEMVQAAIKGLKERGGSSLIAIKKYIAANYKVDVEKLAPFIKKALKSGVTSGTLVQTKGKGASGSFKLSAASKPATKAPKKKPAAKAAGKKTPKKAAAKKPADKKKAAKSPAKAKKPKAKPTKAKKAKSPAKKPKVPKPKKSPSKKPAAKKTAAKK